MLVKTPFFARLLVPRTNRPEFHILDLNVARARIALSLLAMLSMYIDPTAAGGPFRLSGLALVTILCHLTYSWLTYFAVSRHHALAFLTPVSIFLDLFFATAIAFITEGATSPSYAFFIFAIVAAGIRPGVRVTIAVTLASVALYLAVIALPGGLSDPYMMRAVYLAIAGYLVGFVGWQRALFEARYQRISIARSLHDGYIQALAGVNLRLQTCRQLLLRARPADALKELDELQCGVTREYDQVRSYVRSLAEIAPPASGFAQSADIMFRLQANLTTRGLLGEHLLLIMLEGLRNARRHAMGNSVAIEISSTDNKVILSIQDDGVGFGRSDAPPWAIASRVAELGGRVTIERASGPARLSIEMPAL
jgi:signal transduction histidine kinase